MNTKKLKFLIDKHHIISFDIFDTLLKRNVCHPYDVFKLIEIAYNSKHQDNPIHKFCNIRIEAEKQARQKSDREDVTLDLIYSELPFEVAICQELKQLELEIEKEVSVCNYSMQKIYDYAIQQGKKVVAVSEMYLPTTFIQGLLKKSGYNKIDKIYVSSETGKMKKSGSLFRVMINDYHIKPQYILHIGDAKRSDWIVPKLLGMSSFKIKTHYNHTSYFKLSPNADFNERLLYSFINNNLPLDINQRIGFETFGPLLLGFCYWIHSFVQQKKLKRVLFLSRDGQIIEKAYKLIYPDAVTKYVYASRKALTVPLLHFQKEWKNIVQLIPRAIHIEVSALIERLGLDVKNHIHQLKELGLDPNEVIKYDKLLSDPRFETLYKQLKTTINNNSKREYEACANYFHNLNLQQTECIVDLGWKGTIQKALETLFPLYGLDTHLEALYLGISLERSNAYGYVYDSKNMSQMIYVRSSLGLIETLFSSNHGTLLKYGLKSPILDKFEYDNSLSTYKDYQTISQIQSGALLFIKQFSQNALSKYIEINEHLAFKAMKNLCTNPTKQDLKKLGNLSFFDTAIVPLAKPSKEDYFSFRKLKYDFSHSHWKIGYLRRFFKLPLPYLYIYALLRKIMVR